MVAVLAGAVLALPGTTGVHAESEAGGYAVTIRRDGYGVPHVLADDFPSLGYGIGYAFAQDNICTLMDYTVDRQRRAVAVVRADSPWTFGGNGTSNTNLDSDFFYESVNQSGVLERPPRPAAAARPAARDP